MKKPEMDKLLALTEAWTDCALRTDNVHRARLYAECKRDLLDLLETIEVDPAPIEEVQPGVFVAKKGTSIFNKCTLEKELENKDD